ncbi:MAG: PatB family C-S lyase [Marinilabiliaceae bacterium]|jgi:cystathionine beta-lyase|nr:PatB family C-S lyase [Marinilabiliaceae bacterium]
MIYNFDLPVDRQGTNCVKYDLRKEVFGSDKLIPMWVADMDFLTPPFIIDAIKERLKHEILGYTVRRDEYFETLVSWTERHYGWKIDKEWILFSPGIVPAVNICTLAYTKPGDSIIVQPPVYFPFFGAVKDHGRKLLFNRLRETEGRYYFDFDDLRKKAERGAKMLILSNPHNPVGRAWNKDELAELAEICLEYNIIIISDEIHSDLVLPGFKHLPTASLSEKTASLTITCYAPSKTFNLAGLSTSSVVISDKELRHKFQKQIDSLHISGGNIFGTEASIAAYSKGEEWLSQLLDYIAKNVKLVVEKLNSGDLPLRAVIPEATYMIWLDCRKMKMGGKELNEFFINKAGIGMNEGSMFGPGGEGYMRMNLACPTSILEKALDKIVKAIKNNF